MVNKRLDWMELHPLAVLTILMGLRDIVFGLMLALSDPAITGSNLYINLDTLGAIPEYGYLLSALGLASIGAAIKGNSRVASWTMGLQAWAWGFVTVGMFVAGLWSLGLLYGVGFLGLTSWIGYRHKWIRKTGISSPLVGTYVRSDI
jgi:hypothetical protein